MASVEHGEVGLGGWPAGPIRSLLDAVVEAGAGAVCRDIDKPGDG